MPVGRRWLKPRVPTALLARALSVEVLPILGLPEYREQCPPLLPDPTPVPADASLRHYGSVADAVNNISLGQYFQSEDRGDGIFLTDDFVGSPYYSRQRMLQSAYRSLIGESLEGHSVLDIGCSSGYYSFYCARMGADRVLGIDARLEHEDQFRLLHSMLALPDSCAYRHLDAERDLASLEPSFDLVLAQGLLYHLYDHRSFMQNVFRLTRRVLVLESLCSGHWGNVCRAALEDTGNLRMGIHGPAMVPSLPWVARLMRWAGFEEIHYVPLPAGVPDAWGFRRWYRVMFVGVKS